ncbi:MAG: c-type cytochrome biogenesis protein CcmI [Proteobacteria bacterium]|nr:c-type cytochrome biogenesis protein CcmI [Pseudomonadota bacterium]
MSFWLSLAALTALALALLWLPLRRAQADSAAATDDQLRRLREFDSELAAGDIDASIAPALRAELERAVIDGLPASAAAPVSSGGRALLALLCLMAPLAAGGLYWHLGSPELATFSAAHPHTDWRDQATSISYFVGRVRERLAKQPDDADAWALLARTEMQLGHYNEALAAAESLNRVLPEHAGAMLLLVDALLMAGGDEHRSRALALTGKVLHNEPGNPSALVMKGLFEQQEGDTATALATWQQALSLAGQDGGLKSQIEELIARAGGTVQKAAPRVAVKVKVALSPALAARAQAGDAVFIAARAVDGPPMPLAVSRHTVAELPLSITLDDSMAMVPGHSLADVKQFYVMARVSKSGTANASSGDLEGKSATLDIKDAAEIAIDIDRALP